MVHLLRLFVNNQSNAPDTVANGISILPPVAVPAAAAAVVSFPFGSTNKV